MATDLGVHFWSSVGGGGGGTLTFADSIVDTAGTVTLVGDTATPGDSQYYGTNSGGTLGYYNLPVAALPYAGRVSIGSGVSSVAVTFSNALGSTPAVICWLSSSSGSANLITSMGTGISTAGFTALLGSTTTDATYTLNWIASVAND